MPGGRAAVLWASVVLIVPFAAAVPAGLGPEEPPAASAVGDGAADGLRGGLPAGALDPAQAQRLDLARDLLAAQEADGTALDRAIEQARLVDRWQARTLAAGPPDAVPAPGHDRPSGVVLGLLDRHEVHPGPAERERIRALDDLPGPLASELADLVDAFAALEEATERAYTAGHD